MGPNFSTDSRVLENIHALSDARTLKAQLPTELSDTIVKGELSENWVLGSQCMAYFVQRNLLRNQKFVVCSHSTSLEEVTDLVARLDEISLPALKDKKV